jgi:Domain of unknown function (DUF4291)
MEPLREIRALQTPETITVYQAYRNEIADPAVNTNRFVPPFQRSRMTWIKPSFLWMAYRSGYATKANQERVLAIEITKTGFEWALEHSSLSHFEPGTYPDQHAWTDRKNLSPVRIQWDPERGLNHEPLTRRSIQIGISGEAIDKYIDEWIINITDKTKLCHDIQQLVITQQFDHAKALLPVETSFEITETLRTIIGASANKLSSDIGNER